MQKAYFVVEGPHDVEVVGRLLRPHGIRRVKYVHDLDEYWQRLVPRTFPHQGDLLRRVPVPTFFASTEISVAVHSADGIDMILATVQSTLSAIDRPPDGLGVILDADDSRVQERWSAVATKLPVPDAGNGPGQVGDSEPRAGVYVLPDNQQPGTLEQLLLDCAEQAYPSLLHAARSWIEPLDANDNAVFCNAADRKDFSKPSGKVKAIVSSVASVLRPGRAIQVSIQDNQWLKNPRALALPRVQALSRFITSIIGIDDADDGTPAEVPATQ